MCGAPQRVCRWIIIYYFIVDGKTLRYTVQCIYLMSPLNASIVFGCLQIRFRLRIIIISYYYHHYNYYYYCFYLSIRRLHIFYRHTPARFLFTSATAAGQWPVNVDWGQLIITFSLFSRSIIILADCILLLPSPFEKNNAEKAYMYCMGCIIRIEKINK